jgi:hypothetical protein
MDPETARQIAYDSHIGSDTGGGVLLFEHVARVACAVPADARAVAWLHDVLEHTATGVEVLRRAGLTAEELDAVMVLTRPPAESFRQHVLRIAQAPGPAGPLARTVKEADVADHLAHDGPGTSAHPRAWARGLVKAAMRTNGKRLTLPS